MCKSSKITALLLVIFVFCVLISSLSICYSAVVKPPERKPVQTVVVGSYGGYWGLNAYFINLLSKYFTVDQMKSIDKQIQKISGILEKPYNYCTENHSSYGSAGYYYRPETGTWDFAGSVGVGKHYSELYDKCFYIDAETAEVKAMGSSRELMSNPQSLSAAVGKEVNIKGQEYKIVGARNWSPIILDLDGDGKVSVARGIWTPHAPEFYQDRTCLFDLTGDGEVEFCEWTFPKDGLLAMPEPDGEVKDATNLFGTAGGYRDGFFKMALVLDKNQDGWVDEEEMKGLLIWVDANGNGLAEKDELKPIETYGIARISVHHKNFVSEFYYKDGRKATVWDWWPSGYELKKI
jgi:hypothetical protein